MDETDKNIDIDAEWMKCAKDFKYFCENYIKILHTSRGYIPFIPHPYQLRAIAEAEANRFCIVSKFRQGGLTTVFVLYALWLASFKLKGNQIMIISKTDREAINTGKIIDHAVERMPEWLRPDMKTKDHEKIFKDTNGAIYFYTIKAARSRSASLLMIDEAAFIPGMKEEWKAVYPTIATGGRCLVISTPNGVGGMGAWYHDIYQKAESGKNNFHLIRIDFTENPEYAKEGWKKAMMEDMGQEAFDQEFGRSFSGGGDTYIPSTTILTLREHTSKSSPIRKMLPQWDKSNTEEDIEIGVKSGALWIWKTPIVGREYLLCADASEGAGGEADFSAFHVIDQTTMEQVAEFYSNTIDPFNFASVIFQTGTTYNTAQVVVERGGGGGIGTLEILQKSLSYENLFFKRSKNKYKAGFVTNNETRTLMMEKLRHSIIHEKVKINSTRLLNELETIVYNCTRKRVEALRRKHDDLVMALAIGIQVLGYNESIDLPYLPRDPNEQKKMGIVGDIDLETEIYDLLNKSTKPKNDEDIPVKKTKYEQLVDILEKTEALEKYKKQADHMKSLGMFQ